MFRFLLYSSGISCILSFILIVGSFFLIHSSPHVYMPIIGVAIVFQVYYFVTAVVVKTKYKKELDAL